jgi:hypothetical protein
MNTMLVYFLMLKPALIATVLVVGIPVALGVWLYPYIRARMRNECSTVSRLGHTAIVTRVGFGP